MDRKNFIQTSGLGIGLALLPGIVSSKGLLKGLTAAKEINPRIIKNKEGKKINVLGDKMTLKLTGEDTNNLYTLIEQNNEPGIGIPMHVHTQEDEIFRVIEGQLELTVGGKTTILNPGDLGFCPRNIPHAWRVVGENHAKVDLSFFPSGMEHMFEKLAQLPPGPPDMKKVAEICGKYGISFL